MLISRWPATEAQIVTESGQPGASGVVFLGRALGAMVYRVGSGEDTFQVSPGGGGGWTGRGHRSGKSLNHILSPVGIRRR